MITYPIKLEVIKKIRTKNEEEMIKFSATYLPTTLFSLKDSNSTNSGAKSLFLPSPYAIKMALLNQAITVGGDINKLEIDKSKEFAYIRDSKITFHLIEGSSFCVNNSFVKILKPARKEEGFQQINEKAEGAYSGTNVRREVFQQTVAFREYVFLSHPLEIIFEVQSEAAKAYLKTYLHKINYFGKRGCFFQFSKYSDSPNTANVRTFDVQNGLAGVLQEYDDFDEKTTFDKVNNFSSSATKRIKEILVLPVKKISSSKSFSHYKQVSK